MKSFIEYFLLFLTCYFSLIFSANTADNQEFKLAAKNGNLELVRQLVGEGRALANCQNGESLVEAASNGHLEVVRFLVTEGPEETRALANDQDGKALIQAVIHGHYEVVRFLVTEGPAETRALANCQDGEALLWTAVNGRLEVVRELLEMSINTGNFFTQNQFLRALNAFRNLDANTRRELEDIFYNADVPMLK